MRIRTLINEALLAGRGAVVGIKSLSFPLSWSFGFQGDLCKQKVALAGKARALLMRFVRSVLVSCP